MKKQGKRIISHLLVMILCFLCFPITSLAEGGSKIVSVGEEEEISIKTDWNTDIILRSRKDYFLRAVKAMKENIPDLEKIKEKLPDDPYAFQRLLVVADGSFQAPDAAQIIQVSDSLYILIYDSSQDTKMAKQQLEQEGNVRSVEADQIITLEKDVLSTQEEADSTQTEEYYSWGVEAIGADSYAQHIAAQAADLTTTVAVLDTGVDSSHPFIEGKTVEGFNFTDSGEENDTGDSHGHGTHVTGTILDCTRNLDVKVMPLKIFDDNGEASSGDIVLAMKYAMEHGAKLANCSFGGGCKESVEDIFKTAVEQGMTVCVAAGNDNDIVDDTCPAHIECPGLITVAGVDSSEQKSDFSNYGKSIKVAAPATNIYSSVPYEKESKYYAYKNGTSMATPHVTALTAMIAMAYPDYTPSQIQQTIQGACRDLGDEGWDPYYGYGIPDLNQLLDEPYVTVKDSVMRIGISETEHSKTAVVLKGDALDEYELLCEASNENCEAILETKESPDTQSRFYDLILTGKEKGSTSITLSIQNKKSGETVSERKIKVEVYQEVPVLTVTPDEVELDLVDVTEATVVLEATGDVEDYYSFSATKPSLVSCSLGSRYGENKNKVNLTIKTKGMTGTCEIPVRLKDKNTGEGIVSNKVKVIVREISKDHEHSWDEGTVTKVSTCVETGIKTYICQTCKAEKTEEIAIDPANHTGNEELINQKEPTCVEDGYTGDTCCKDCKAILKSGQVLVATGAHISDEGTITKQPTTQTEGERTYFCKVCHSIIKTETIAKLPEEPKEESQEQPKIGKTVLSSVENTGSGILVKWKKVAGATGYLLYRSKNGSSYTRIKTTASTAYTDKKATVNGAIYRYRVVAYKRVGSKTDRGSASSVKSMYRLSQPTIRQAVNRASRKMTVVWKRNSKASGYQLQYCTSADFKKAKTIRLKKNTIVSKTIPSLKKGRTYYVRIRAYRTIGKKAYVSSWSKKKSVKMKK